MRSRSVIAAALATAALAVAGCGGDEETRAASRGGADAGRLGKQAGRLVSEQVAIGPRPTGSQGAAREVELIARELRANGLEPTVQQPRRNVVATVPGSEPGAIVVGAHYDTVDIPAFVGANDSASGVAVLLALSRRLGSHVEGPSITLAFFDAEEAPPGAAFAAAGAAGSRQFVAFARAGEQGAPALGEIEAMYLLDMVGDCDLAIPREASSDPGLYGGLDGSAFGGEAGAVLDDHTPFIDAGIPSVDLIDFTYGPGGTPGGYWHTTEDTIDKVCQASLGQVADAMIGVLGR